jgi:hypothetical protein
MMIRAIYFYADGTKLQVMNYSSLGEKTVTEFLRAQNGKLLDKIEIGAGYTRRWVLNVRDAGALAEAARNDGIEVRGLLA